MGRPICVNCMREMRCKKNGVSVNGQVAHIHRSGDLFRCPKCGTEVISGLSKGWDAGTNHQADFTLNEGD